MNEYRSFLNFEDDTRFAILKKQRKACRCGSCVGGLCYEFGKDQVFFRSRIRRLRAGIKGIQTNAMRNRLFRKIGEEDRAFVRKKHIAPLSKAETSAIGAYWKQFGVRFRDFSSFQMFYATTGIRDPRFLPYNVADVVLYSYYNDQARAKVWADKNQFSRVLPAMPFPVTIAHRVNGRYYDHERNCFGKEITPEFVSALFRRIREIGCGAVVVKATTETSRGLGVKKFSIESEDALHSLLNDQRWKNNYIIQEAVEQHPFFAQFNKSSVNILRLTTWRHENGVEVFAPCLRFGIPGSNTDVAFVKGVEIVQSVGIDPTTGTVADHGYDLNGSILPLEILDRQVPMWDEIVRLVKRNSLSLDYFDIVAWDMTVDRENRVRCFEYNICSPGVIIYQFAHGPLAGEHTDALLAFLREPKNRKRYLPSSIRL